MPILRGYGVPAPPLLQPLIVSFRFILITNRGQQDLTVATLGHCGCTKPKVRLPTRHPMQTADKMWWWYIHEMCNSGKAQNLYVVMVCFLRVLPEVSALDGQQQTLINGGCC